MTRDSKRSQVYAAEDLAGEFTVLASPWALDQLQQVTASLVASEWWTSHFVVSPIAVVANRSGRHSTYHYLTRRISLSPLAHDLGTLCHELAHAAAFDRSLHHESHGGSFRAMHVLVRRAILGRRCGDDLAEVYEQFGLSLDSLSTVGVPARSVLAPEIYDSPSVQGRPSAHPLAKPGPIAL